MIEIELGFPIEQRVHTCVATINEGDNDDHSQNDPRHPQRSLGLGLLGTMDAHAQSAWPIAMNAISDATGQPFEAVRAFLDSRHGRHFADEVLNRKHAGHALHDAIRAATRQWMEWTIGRRTSKDYGIPRGLPYLTGFVIHCAIADESLAA